MYVYCVCLFVLKVEHADTDIINKLYNDSSGDNQILAASDIVHILRPTSIHIKRHCKLTLQLHCPMDQIKSQQRSFTQIHVNSNTFKTIPLQSSKCYVNGDYVTVPVNSFCG